MKRCLSILAVSFVLVGSSFAGTRVLSHTYQPLTNLGTEEDSHVVVTQVPLLINAVPESLIGSMAWPNKILQEESANMPDSNLLSLLKIHVSALLVGDKHYRVTLDLRDMLPSDHYGVTADQVIDGTVKCLQAIFDDFMSSSYELVIQGRKDDKTDWSKHEGRYEAKRKTGGA